METKLKKSKGEIFSKLVWIAAAVIMALMAFGAVRDLQNGVTAKSVCTCITMFAYLVAYVTGVSYLFSAGKDRLALAAACICAAAAVIGFVADLSGGSRYGALNMVDLVVNVLVFLVFPITIAAFLKLRTSGFFSACAKLWWLPYAVSMVVELALSLQTECNDSQGFDISLVIMDLVVAAIYLLPAFMLLWTVKHRAGTK